MTARIADYASKGGPVVATSPDGMDSILAAATLHDLAETYDGPGFDTFLLMAVLVELFSAYRAAREVLSSTNA